MSVGLFIFYIGLSFGLACGELEPPTSRAVRQCWRRPGEVSGERDGFQHQRDKHGSLDIEGPSQPGPKFQDSLATEVISKFSNFLPWSLRYVGQPEMSQKSTVVRSCYDIACSSNVVEFLTELGCRCKQMIWKMFLSTCLLSRLEYEYIAKGFIFRKGRIKVTVSRVGIPSF